MCIRDRVRAVGDAVTDVQGRGDFYDSTDGNSNKEYYYDRNGNMWLDRNKKMKVVYNILNLPAQVIDTVTTSDKTEYVYTSSGVKLKQRLSAGTTLLYNGSFVYELDGTANGIIVKYILTAEGRANYLPGAYTYEYFMKDHLGNIRINFKDSSNVAVIIQQSDYYPFGMIHQPQATTTSDNRYLFNGKELQNNLLDSVNLDLYDYGARFYDPQIGRWNVVDPSAERDHAYLSLIHI
jgi:RHS repeat-associated protein